MTNGLFHKPRDPAAALSADTIAKDKLRGGVSVVIPLYNHEHYIEQAVTSVLAQSRCPDEIVVIDDGSSDGSAEIMQRLCHEHSEIVFWSQPNQGAHSTINAGIERARGEYLAILNSDDVYHPDRLAECLHVLEREPSVTAVFTAIDFMDEHGRRVDNPWYEQARAFYDRGRDLGLALVNGNFFMTTSNLVIRRAAFDEIGRFAALRYAHDLDFFLRLQACGKQLRLLDRPLLSYRLHPNNTIREDARKVKVEWAAASALFLYSIWRDNTQRDWSYLERFIEITDRNGLTASVLAFLTFFERYGPTNLAGDSYLKDREFCEFIHRLTR